MSDKTTPTHNQEDFSALKGLDSVERSREKATPKLPLTFGEQLVGITFNPSNDDKVAKAKTLCAELANLLHDEITVREYSMLSSILYSATVSKILDAQMNVVKLLTLKY